MQHTSLAVKTVCSVYPFKLTAKQHKVTICLLYSDFILRDNTGWEPELCSGSPLTTTAIENIATTIDTEPLIGPLYRARHC